MRGLSAGSSAKTLQSKPCATMYFFMPMAVPPLPTPATMAFTEGNAEKISGAVVSKCALTEDGLPN